jgi:MoaA/NifB/PqqE/SkfB family radical SAM enzyme
MDAKFLLRSGVRRLGGMAREGLYLRTGIDATMPESISCEVNERCNYKCRYCHFWRLDDYVNEMTIEEWQRTLLGLQEFLGRCTVQFIGGEPFLKKGFVDLLEFCRQNGIDWGVITNGSALTARISARVAAAHPTNIDISIDSPIDSINDFVRGAPGSLATIEAGVRRLRTARDDGNHHFPIRIKPTITRINFRSLPLLAEWIARCGADTIDFQPVHSVPFWTAAMRAELWPTPEECEEMRVVIGELVQQQKSGAPIETAAERLLSIPDQFLGRTVQTSIPGPCRVSLRKLAIKANGDVRTCWDFAAIGNVRHASPRDIWYGAAARGNRAQTVACPKVGAACANSCNDPRSLRQDIERGLLMLRSTMR